MSKLQELINELCPDGVEWKKLGEVCEIKGRIGFRGYTRNDLVDEQNGAITLSPSNIIDGAMSYNNCSYISWNKYEESPEIKVSVGDIIFTKTASIGKTALIRFLPKEATINPQLVLLKNIKCNSGYLSYILQDTRFQTEVKKKTGLGSVPNIPQSALSEITIPIPPLVVQTEIVRILDSFTNLAAELQAELQARKEQYEFYRNKLLSFDDLGNGIQVEWKKMSEIEDIVIKRGVRVVKSQLSTEGCIPVYQNSLIPMGYYCKPNFSENTSYIICAGSAGEIGYSDKPFWAADDCFCCVCHENYSNRFLYYVLKNKQHELKNKVRKASIPRLSRSAIENLEIPLPPLAEQKRIAEILDRFEALTTDLSEGLPAEIAAVQEQYEYYRNKLLTFNRLSA